MSKIRILVVDDEPEFCNIVEMALTQAGYEVRSAYNIADAVELCKETLPHVALLDVILINETGIDAIEKIREIDKRVKLIMVSGMLDLEIAKEAIARGAEEYFTKPLNFRKLDEYIQDLVKDSPG